MARNNLPSTAHVPSLEKIPHAAHRMGCSISQTYREIKAGRLGPIIKIGIRASALSTAAVDSWIAAKIAAAPQWEQL